MKEAPSAPHRLTHIVMAVAIAVAFVGFFIGVRQTHDARPVIEREAPPPAAGAPTAVSYLEMDWRRFSPNGDWRSYLSPLIVDPDEPAEPGPFSSAGEAERRRALAERFEHRAYDGAPPVIPHAINQLETASCLACHATGARIGGRVARPMSHAAYANCTQCHVPVNSSPHTPGGDAEAALLTPSGFEGIASSGRGERAWEGAPPTIPHGTLMRDNCLSCHGSLGREPIRTAHPWRSSCTQCHVPSAEIDQHDFRQLMEMFEQMEDGR